MKLSSLTAKRDNSNRGPVLCVKIELYNFNLKQVAVDINNQKEYI